MVSYLIKYIVCSGILLAVYHLFLEREKMFRFNRLYLMAAMILPLLMPLATIEMPSQSVEEAIPVMQNINNVQDFDAAMETQPVAMPIASKLPDYLPWIGYALVSALLLARLIIQILTILRSKTGRRTIPFETARLVLVPGKFTSYTFFNFIFISQETYDHEPVPKAILSHELAHAQQMHSLDILLAELLLSLCWFNPLLLLYRRAIRLNHEYLADEAALNGVTDTRPYQLLLLDTLIAQRQTALTSSFNYSITKKRLAMMNATIHHNKQLAKQTATVLLVAILAFTFSEKTYSQKNPAKPSPALPAKAADKSPATGQGITKAEMDEFFAIMEKHTHYVTDKNGRRGPVTEIDTKTLKEEFAVFSRMSETQQLAVRKAGISLYEGDIPVKKTPAPEMFENWKKPHIFGIWLNGKHVPNTELNKYNNTDIAEYTLHRLVGSGLKGKGYKYQLELTTNDEFDRTFEQRVRDRIVLVRITWFEPPKVKVEAKK